MIKKGDITQELSPRPGAPVTHEALEKALDIWFETYLFFMIIRTGNPQLQDKIAAMQARLGEAHEAVTGLLDAMLR